MPKELNTNETVLAIDPGNFNTAYCLLRGDRKILAFDKVPNETMANRLRLMLNSTQPTPARPDVVAIEQVASYGMAVGASVFDTCVWIGRYIEIVDGFAPWHQVVRLEVKLAICRSPKANDSSIRASLIDLFGPQGTKAMPGPTYGISKDVWAALALAETVRSGEFRPYIPIADRNPAKS